MISRAVMSGRPGRGYARLLGAVACAGLALALGVPAASAAECGNESLRGESKINPVSGEPYSAGLPDCRAYEMVSPPYKQAHDVSLALLAGLGAAPDGGAAAFISEGDFTEPDNFFPFENAYVAQRDASGWASASTFAPRSLVDNVLLGGLHGDSSPDLRSAQVSCGLKPLIPADETFQTVVCARRQAGGSWLATPVYSNPLNSSLFEQGPFTYRGGANDLSRLIIEPTLPLLPAEAASTPGIYEIVGCCTGSSRLRLVSVDNAGKELVLPPNSPPAPLVGGFNGFGEAEPGTEYHAISKSGDRTFFTASPEGSSTQTIYARVACAAHAAAPCAEDGGGEWFETVTVSNPSPAERCPASTPAAATFQGASADGSKVFFTTKQKLLNQDATTNLYEYDFNARNEGKCPLVLISKGEEAGGAKVRGVVRSSPDGSHVYFVAQGVLTGEEANGNGEKALAGNANLYGYGYDPVTKTEKVKFVAATDIAGSRELTEENGLPYEPDHKRRAQTTPDGRYLLFSSGAENVANNAGDTNIKAGCASACPLAVYRYDFQTGELIWVSRGAPGFAASGEGHSAVVAALPGAELGAYANIDDWSRAISGCPTRGELSESEGSAFNCPEGEYDGEYIVFTTAEKLQANDVNSHPDVYEWHNGTVALISDGRDPHGVSTTAIEAGAAMSASGSDIFFTTHTPLVGQDTDVLGDLYDARVGGGFPAPAAKSCSGDACQDPPSEAPSFGSAASSLFSGGANLKPSATSTTPPPSSKPKATPKPLTRAQKLAKALRACKAKPKKKRKLCEAQARKRYGSKAKPKSNKKGRRGG